MNADILRTIYLEIYGPLNAPGKMRNLRELAATLSKIAKREKPWTHRYLNSLLNGDSGFRVTPELDIALRVLATKLDGANPLQARLVEITVYSVNGHTKPSSIILGESKRCKGCQVLMVPRVPWQDYCGKECPGRPKRKRAKLGEAG